MQSGVRTFIKFDSTHKWIPKETAVTNLVIKEGSNNGKKRRKYL